MTRLQRLESKGYKVESCYNSVGTKTVHAIKNCRRYVGTSVTNLHLQIFGY